MKKKTAVVFVFLFAFLSVVFVGCARTNGTDDSADERSSEIVNSDEAENAAETGSDEPEEKDGEESGEEAEKGGTEFILYIRSKTDGLNVRTGAGTSYKSLGTLDKGDMAAYFGEKNGWYETRYLGKTAYVSASEAFTEKVAMKKGEEKTERVIEEGFNLLGTKYVYGAVRLHDGTGRPNRGFDVTAFDCSSLMQYIFYYGADEILQVNTRTQVGQGKSVEKAALERGDLLFFTNASRYYKTGTERIGHVALYLGDGYILHTASDHAVAEKISDKRWSYYICARRIISE